MMSRWESSRAAVRSPVYGRSLGLGIVRTDLVSLGDTVAVGEPDADITCRVVPLPIELPHA